MWVLDLSWIFIGPLAINKSIPRKTYRVGMRVCKGGTAQELNRRWTHRGTEAERSWEENRENLVK